MKPTIPDTLAMPFAYEGARNTIPGSGGEDTGNASLSLGFPPITQQPLTQGGLPPQRKDFNGILYILSAYAHYAQSGGLYAYDETLDYVPNCIITHNNNIYICLADNGATMPAGVVEPGTDDTCWQTLYEYLFKGNADNVGSSTTPIYIKDGVFTASSSSVGSATKPIYLSDGVLTASGATVGSGAKPVYLSGGTITASDSTVGSGTKPVYLSSGTVTASSSNAGGTAKPVYMDGGTIKAISATVGSGTKPVYLSSGTITASGSSVGSTSTPVYMDSGTLKTCSSILAISASSKTTSGYCKFSNGLLLQWGYVNQTGASSYWITYPTAFSSTTYQVVGWDGGSYKYAFAGAGLTATGFTLYGTQTTVFRYLAIGY